MNSELSDIKKKEDFLVVFPVYNEKEAIENMIRGVSQKGYSLVITDGGSTDGSIEIAEKYQVPILHRPGKGKGYGLKMALDYAYQNSFQYMVYMDCDMTYPIKQIPDLLQYRNEYDMVVGNRNRKNMRLKSKILNFILVHLLNFVFNKNLKDPASGFRVLKVDRFYNQIQIEGIDVEFDLLGIAYRNQLSIKEVDVNYHLRVGESKLTFFEIIQVVFTIIKVRFIH